MGIVSDITNYFSNRKRDREERATIMDASKRFPEDEHIFPVYRRAMRKASEISDEEAIKSAISEKQYYDKAKLIEEKVRSLLEKYEIDEPVTFPVSDVNLRESMYVLDVKGIEMPNESLEEPQITAEEIRAGLQRACIGIQAAMQYYNIPTEEIAKMASDFEEIASKEIRDEDYPEATKTSDSVARRYSVPEIFARPDGSDKER